jgi:hypothetical protein
MEMGRRRRVTPALVLTAIGLALGGAWLPAAGPARAQDDLDLTAILRCAGEDEQKCDKSRELVIYYCTACHSFVPIVMQQFDEGGWQGLIDRHRGWIPALKADDLDHIRLYLTENFRPDLDPPELPPNLLENWTSY